MPQQPEVVIVDAKGVEHVFPAGFDPKRAAAVVRGGAPQAAAPAPLQEGTGVRQKVVNAAMMVSPLGALKAAKEHPAQTGAILGGLAVAPLTGGMSLLPAAAVSGGASAVGAGAGQLLSGQPLDKTIGKEALLGATGEVGGRAVASLAKLLGRGLYRTALAPTQGTLKKYGSELIEETPVPRIVTEGLNTKTPVSLKGLKQATDTKTARMGEKASALAQASPNVGFSSDLIAQDASQPLADYATKQVRAGLPDPTSKMADRLTQFRAANPQGSLNPNSLEEIKHTLDNISGDAYQKLRAKQPITPREKTTLEMGQAMSRAQESAVPKYREMNRGIMTAEGLRQAIERRTLGSGGNQVLDTLLAVMHPTVGAAGGRIAMMPPVMSRLGIAAHGAGQSRALPETLKAALIAAFGSPDTP